MRYIVFTLCVFMLHVLLGGARERERGSERASIRRHIMVNWAILWSRHERVCKTQSWGTTLRFRIRTPTWRRR